jgi:hypothetical protein
MNDETTNHELPVVSELLTLEDGTGDALHVHPAAYADFDAAIDVSLEELVARWAPFASPQAQGRNTASWRR